MFKYLLELILLDLMMVPVSNKVGK
jgi:hypothetical protein